jgi:hypothetical protein
MKTAFHALLIPICCYMLSCSDSPESHRLPFGALNPPAPNAIVRGQLLVGGWAIHESGVVSVDLYIDREFVQTANVGVSRPDVAAAFPQFKVDMMTGFSSSLNTVKFPDGPHELVARIKARNKVIRDLTTTFISANFSVNPNTVK